MSITVGMKLEPITLAPITQDQLRAYADASGDFNQIHLNEDVAKKSGLPGVIAHGMLISAFLARRATDAIFKDLDLNQFRLVKYQTRFRAMTFLGDTPIVGGSVKEWSSDEIVLDLQAKNQRGELIATGSARFQRISQ